MLLFVRLHLLHLLVSVVSLVFSTSLLASPPVIDTRDLCDPSRYRVQFASCQSHPTAYVTANYFGGTVNGRFEFPLIMTGNVEHTMTTGQKVWAYGQWQTIGLMNDQSKVNGGMPITADISNLGYIWASANPSDQAATKYFRANANLGVANLPPASPGYLPSSDTMEKLVNAVSSVDPGFVSTVMGEFKANGFSWSSAPKVLTALGQEIAGSLSGALTRVGSIFVGGGVAALNPETAQGAAALHAAIKDDTVTHGLWNQEANKQLRAVMQDMENRDSPISPTSTDGQKSNFQTPVQRGQVVPIDPFIATGFEYAINPGSPLIASFILPHLSEAQTKYEIELLIDGKWVKVGDAMSMREYVFGNPVSEFRVLGIDPSLKVNEQTGNWVSGLTFDRDGTFSGSVTALGINVPAVPEPESWAMLIAGLAVVGIATRRKLNQSGCPMTTGRSTIAS